jgi:signal transduction histidine kinase
MRRWRREAVCGYSRPKRWRHRWGHSLRLRLITVFLLLALCMGAVFMGGMQRAFSTGWRDAAKPLITDYMDRLVADLGSPPDVGRAQALAARLPISIRIEGPEVNWQSHPDKPDRKLKFFEGRANDWLSRTTADGHRVIFGPGTIPWQGAPHGMFGWITLALLLGLLIGAYAYVRRLLRPLDDIRAGAERFGRGVFDKPIPLRRRDELGELAQRINTMALDIEDMLNAKRGLLLALSHELRSPLTRARLNAELLPASGEGSAPRERDALLRDLGEMRDLIGDLLESERLASPHAALRREEVDLAALVREVAAEMPAAAGVQLDLAGDLPALALDRMRVRLLVRNLLDNALRYSADAGRPPQVLLQSAEGGVLLEVRDFGPGVDPDQIERLTEPFYRTDGARQRATGGVGLGMYLCRLVAEAHGAQLQVRNAAPGLAVQVLWN